MKIDRIEKSEVAMCFVVGENVGYLRANPHGFPIWYHAIDTGFELIGHGDKYHRLEEAYNEQEQQASKEAGVSQEHYLASLKGPEGAKPH